MNENTHVQRHKYTLVILFRTSLTCTRERVLNENLYLSKIHVTAAYKIVISTFFHFNSFSPHKKLEHWQ